MIHVLLLCLAVLPASSRTSAARYSCAEELVYLTTLRNLAILPRKNYSPASELLDVAFGRAGIDCLPATGHLSNRGGGKRQRRNTIRRHTPSRRALQPNGTRVVALRGAFQTSEVATHHGNPSLRNRSPSLPEGKSRRHAKAAGSAT